MSIWLNLVFAIVLITFSASQAQNPPMQHCYCLVPGVRLECQKSFPQIPTLHLALSGPYTTMPEKISLVPLQITNGVMLLSESFMVGQRWFVVFLIQPQL